MILRMIKLPSPNISWTKRLINFIRFVTLAQASRVTLKPLPRTLWLCLLKRSKKQNLPIRLILPWHKINKWNFLRLCIISRKQVILIPQIIRLVIVNFGTVWFIIYVISQTKNKNSSYTLTLLNPVAHANYGCKINNMIALPLLTISLLLKKICPTSPKLSLNPLTWLPPTMIVPLIPLKWLTSILLWKRLLANFDTTGFPGIWYMMPWM